MALDRPAFREWWPDIEQRYRVRANVGMDGSAYAKFGTTFDNQIIVIDNDAPTVTDAVAKAEAAERAPLRSERPARQARPRAK